MFKFYDALWITIYRASFVFNYRDTEARRKTKALYLSVSVARRLEKGAMSLCDSISRGYTTPILRAERSVATLRRTQCR
jgi:hypothetical protein